MEGKEKRVEEKEVEKREKGKKWFWQKSFLFLFDCVFASFFFFFFLTIKFCGLLPEYQLAACQPHSLKRERGGDYCAMASCQGVLNEG